MAYIYSLGPTSGTAIVLEPTYAFADVTEKIQSEHRTQSGKSYIYKWGDYRRFSIPVEYFSVSSAAIINSWWETNTELLFFISSDSGVDVSSVRISNKSAPFVSFAKPYDDEMNGTILLETY